MNLQNLNVILHKKAWTMRFVLLLLFLDSSMPCITSRAYFFHWCYFELLFVETSTMCTSLLAVCGQNPLIMSMGWSIFGSTISEYSYTIVVFPTQFSFSFFGSSSSFIVWVYFSLAAIVSDTAMYVSVRHFCVSLFSFFVDIRSYLIESPYHSYGSRPVFVFYACLMVFAMTDSFQIGRQLDVGEKDMLLDVEQVVWLSNPSSNSVIKSQIITVSYFWGGSCCFMLGCPS